MGISLAREVRGKETEYRINILIKERMARLEKRALEARK
jgi:hypothetical protein